MSIIKTERDYLLQCLEYWMDENWQKNIADDVIEERIRIALLNYKILSKDKTLLTEDKLLTARDKEKMAVAIDEYMTIWKQIKEEKKEILNCLEVSYESETDAKKIEQWKQEANHRYQNGATEQ